MADKNSKSPQQWGISDLDALKAWQGRVLEVHLSTNKVVRGELVGYGSFTLTLKVGEALIVVNKGAVAWYALGG